MLPPPAPISTNSTVVIQTGRPLPGAKRRSLAASKEKDTSGFPSSTIANFAVVPPISNASSLFSPAFPPISAADNAPAAGPDSSNWTGTLLASCKWVNPPLESINIKDA